MNLIDKLSIVWGPEPPLKATAATPATGSEQSVGVATVANCSSSSP